MNKLGVHSEVGRLREVMVHRPDLSLRRLTPDSCWRRSPKVMACVGQASWHAVLTSSGPMARRSTIEACRAALMRWTQ